MKFVSEYSSNVPAIHLPKDILQEYLGTYDAQPTGCVFQSDSLQIVRIPEREQLRSDIYDHEILPMFFFRSSLGQVYLSW